MYINKKTFSFVKKNANTIIFMKRKVKIGIWNTIIYMLVVISLGVALPVRSQNNYKVKCWNNLEKWEK